MNSTPQTENDVCAIREATRRIGAPARGKSIHFPASSPDGRRKNVDEIFGRQWPIASMYTALQWVAMLTMLIDHIGIAFFPFDPAWRIVGRIAFPIYAYGIAHGISRTRNRRAYMIRLAVLAAVSQIPYMLALNTQKINVIASFLLASWVIVQSERSRGKLGRVFLILAAASILEVFHFDYGAYGLFIVLIYRYLAGWKMIAAHAGLNVVFWAAYGPSWMIQLYSILPTILLAAKKEYFRIMRPPAWLWRAFYPAHLSIIYFGRQVKQIQVFFS